MRSIISVSLRSASLWTIGALYFLVFFCITALGMILFSPKTIYPAVRILARMQLLIMSVNLRTLGLENVNQKHSYIVIGNHESLFDIFALPAADRKSFVERFGKIMGDTETRCYALVLIPNHFHLLLKTGSVPISTVMRRLLTGYSISHNKRHRRHGHLFKNRYPG